MNDTIAAGDRVLLLDPANGERFLIDVDDGGARKIRGLGVVDPGRLAGQAWGTVTHVGAKRVALLRPSLPDLVATLRRKAQIITPKDASRIVYELGLGPGDRVLESGIGSGGTTLPLLWAVAPGGRVVAQELREDFAQWATRNAENAGLADGLEAFVGDLTQGVAAGVADLGPYDAVLLDQPEPWLAVPHVATPDLLVPGARLAAYTPQVSQMEQTVQALEAAGFVDVRAMELIERGWKVGARGSRPSFDGLGHTGFLVFGRYLPPATSSAQHG